MTAKMIGHEVFKSRRFSSVERAERIFFMMRERGIRAWRPPANLNYVYWPYIGPIKVKKVKRFNIGDEIIPFGAIRSAATEDGDGLASLIQTKILPPDTKDDFVLVRADYFPQYAKAEIEDIYVEPFQEWNPGWQEWPFTHVKMDFSSAAEEMKQRWFKKEEKILGTKYLVQTG